MTATFGIALAFGLWWIYFDFLGRRFAKPHVAWKVQHSYLHLPLLISFAAVGAGIQSVVANKNDDLIGEQWLIAVAVGLSLVSIGLIEHTLPIEEDEPVDQRRSANLKIFLGVFAPLVIGWLPLGTYALLGILLGFVLILVLYGTINWFKSPISQKKNEGTSNNSSGAETDL